MPDNYERIVTCSQCNREVRYYDTCNVSESPGCRGARSIRMCWHCADQWQYWSVGEEINCEDAKELGSLRKFGIEIETSACPNYRTIKEKTRFGAKPDGSITGVEFISPILQGDAGFDEVKKFLAYAKELKFKVDDDCGLHIHIDVRDLTPLQKRKIAYAFAMTREVWISFVTTYRAYDCSYCHEQDFSPDNVRDCRRFSSFADHQNRYDWINITANRAHGSFEIRLHQGSVKADEICNWIKALLRFADTVKDMKYRKIDELFKNQTAVIQFEGVKRLWKNKGLSRYYNRKTRLEIDLKEEARRRSARFHAARKAERVLA